MRPDDYPYLIALTQNPRWANKNINEFIDRIYTRAKIHPADFFTLSEQEWWDRFAIPSDIVHILATVREKAASYTPLTVSLQIQGFGITVFNDEDYPPQLFQKQQLKAAPLLYYRGDKSILKRPAVAILGCRNCSERALQFAAATADNALKAGKVVIGGFEKEIDFQLLEHALHAKGAYIGVLPQGVLTFDFDRWEKPIAEGNLLLVSTLHPKASVTPVRTYTIHPLLYGLSESIYIAETANHGRTWEGALEGIKNGCRVVVRQPEPGEDNANQYLIDKGAEAMVFTPPSPDVISTNESPEIEDPATTLSTKEQLSWFEGDEAENDDLEELPVPETKPVPPVPTDQLTLFELFEK